MTLEEKQAELQELVQDYEIAFEEARLRLSRASLENEAAARAKRAVEGDLTSAKIRLAAFKDYFDPEKN